MLGDSRDAEEVDEQLGNKENVVKSYRMVIDGNLEFALRDCRHGLFVAHNNLAFGRIDGG